MASYKTPGVYVEEIAKFPPSVAQVETAIPAFIGYTQMAKKNSNNDLLNVPTKIGSMIEFVQYYGGAPSVNITDVNLDSLNQVTSVNLDDNYYLFESMRMFFANGGGFCYIVSVGKYGDSIVNGDGLTPGLLKGLNALRKADEPTLLLAPDASLMSQSNMNTLHTAMLDQCAELQDRFAVFDVRKAEGLESFDDTISNFRNGIGMSNLKYGAAYAPWLVANLPREVKYRDFKGKIKQNGATISLAGLINDSNAQALATRLDKLTADQLFISSSIETIYSGSSSVQAKFDELTALIKSIDGSTSAATAKTRLGDVINLFGAVGDFMLGTVKSPSPNLTDTGDPSYLVEFLRTKINASLASVKATIENLAADANAATTTGLGMTVTLPASFGAGTVSGLYTGSDTIPVKVKSSLSTLVSIWSDITSPLEMIISTTDSFVNTVETAAIDAIPALKSILRAIATDYVTLPPSSSVVGIYARVDGDRGVWKAPANVSLSNVIGVTELIDNRDQADLNVDVVAGKSINIIRPFTGKGTLVWGARTLAGNDNEWRYISVRRFFIMVEESVRKASEQFVFEGNDANTWVKIRAMIENFLTLQWRAGALTGAKPEQAYYVRVGLGQTMTADDILNGYMNIEIGMAVVRPAEFIVLKFSHKMQEA